jgi:kynurenine 3-monooxygenase
MTTDATPRITIAGAGLAGSLLACLMARRGFRVEVLERRPDPRAAGFVGGRSINLALSTRGLHALERVGLAEKVLADAVPMRGRMMHDEQGRLTYQRYSRLPGEAINSVSRGGLNVTLLEAADASSDVTLHFGQRCTDVDLERAAVTISDDRTGEARTVEGELVIGADGAFSAVRGAMQRTERFDYSQSYLEHGYKELTIPPAADGDFAMEPHALHIWPRGGYMMIALPNSDRSFTCTLFWPYAGPTGFESVRTPQEILTFFERHFGDAVPLIPTLVEDYQRNPIGSLVTVRCRPWHFGDTAVLLGDAAHAIVPFFGQGMNAAFEDCGVLDDLIETHGPDWTAVLPRFSASRIENADAIADMALDNFIEMRDKVGSTTFLLKKKLQQVLHGLFPRTFLPLYNMVSFSRIPYAEARRMAARQARLLRGTLATITVLIAAGLLWWALRWT